MRDGSRSVNHDILPKVIYVKDPTTVKQTSASTSRKGNTKSDRSDELFEGVLINQKRKTN